MVTVAEIPSAVMQQNLIEALKWALGLAVAVGRKDDGFILFLVIAGNR